MPTRESWPSGQLKEEPKMSETKELLVGILPKGQGFFVPRFTRIASSASLHCLLCFTEPRKEAEIHKLTIFTFAKSCFSGKKWQFFYCAEQLGKTRQKFRNTSQLLWKAWKFRIVLFQIRKSLLLKDLLPLLLLGEDKHSFLLMIGKWFGLFQGCFYALFTMYHWSTAKALNSLYQITLCFIVSTEQLLKEWNWLDGGILDRWLVSWPGKQTAAILHKHERTSVHLINGMIYITALTTTYLLFGVRYTWVFSGGI